MRSLSISIKEYRDVPEDVSISENFYENIGKFDSTIVNAGQLIKVLEQNKYVPSYENGAYYSATPEEKKKYDDELDTFLKDISNYSVKPGKYGHLQLPQGAFDYVVDVLSSAILDTKVKPGKNDGWYNIPSYLIHLYRIHGFKELKLYTDAAIAKILDELWKNDSLKETLTTLFNETRPDPCADTILTALTWAAMKYFKIIEDNVMFRDILKDDTGIPGSYVLGAVQTNTYHVNRRTLYKKLQTLVKGA